MNIAVFASGLGSTFESLLNAKFTDEPPFKVTLFITDNVNAGALKIAKSHGIKSQCFPINKNTDFTKWDHEVTQYLISQSVDTVLLLGFLKKIGPELISNFNGRLINIHPSLLPKYGGKGMYGRRIHEAVLQNQEEITGVTIHQVTPKYDEGPILKQKKVAVYDTDTPETLEARVKDVEKQLLIEFLTHWKI